MKLVLEAMDFLELASTNHKLPCSNETAHLAIYSSGHFTLSRGLCNFSSQNSALSNSSKLVSWNSSTSCFLTESIGAQGAMSRSKTLAIS